MNSTTFTFVFFNVLFKAVSTSFPITCSPKAEIKWFTLPVTSIRNGFKDVNQLQGGIIEYAHQVKEKGLESKFRGKNFVFDDRLGERVTDDILASCHVCGSPCVDHTHC